MQTIRLGDYTLDFDTDSPLTVVKGTSVYIGEDDQWTSTCLARLEGNAVVIARYSSVVITVRKECVDEFEQLTGITEDQLRDQMDYARRIASMSARQAHAGMEWDYG